MAQRTPIPAHHGRSRHRGPEDPPAETLDRPQGLRVRPPKSGLSVFGAETRFPRRLVRRSPPGARIEQNAQITSRHPPQRIRIPEHMATRCWWAWAALGRHLILIVTGQPPSADRAWSRRQPPGAEIERVPARWMATFGRDPSTTGVSACGLDPPASPHPARTHRLAARFPPPRNALVERREAAFPPEGAVAVSRP